MEELVLFMDADRLWWHETTSSLSPFLRFHIISGCIHPDKIYLGSPLNRMEGFNVNNDYGKTKNAAACQILCQKTPKCKWFNMDKKKHCFLKTDMGNKSQEEVGGATGPGFCAGKWKVLYSSNFSKSLYFFTNANLFHKTVMSHSSDITEFVNIRLYYPTKMDMIMCCPKEALTYVCRLKKYHFWNWLCIPLAQPEYKHFP